MLRIYAIIIIVGIIGSAAYGAKYYYETTQNTIAQLRENNTKLVVANETNQATINQMQADSQLLQETIGQLNVDLQEATAYKDELISKLQRHDLSRLSLRKPGLIEKRINDGTSQVFDDLEELSRPPVATDSIDGN
jgi:ABC-type transport system involved in cytochrome bd biosynthesis fused ATPase/permease subunit